MALITTAGLATVVTLSMQDRQPGQVVTAAAQSSDVLEIPTTIPIPTIPNLTVDTNTASKLTCQGEMMMTTSYDSLAGMGYATPEEALDVLLADQFPKAPRALALTGRNQSRARFENERGAFLVAFLEDGLWHMDQSTICASEDWSRGGATDPHR